MYFTFKRPILEYGDVIWDRNIQYLAIKIEHVQIEAMKIEKGKCTECIVIQPFSNIRVNKKLPKVKV